MEELQKLRLKVEAAAARGARSASTAEQVVADAVERTLERWEDAVLRGKTVFDWEAWAFRTAENAGKRLGNRRKGRAEVQLRWDAQAGEPRGNWKLLGKLRAAVREKIQERQGRLIGRQMEVLLKVTEPEMTLHRAARELGMDRTAVRRSFQRGLARLAMG